VSRESKGALIREYALRMRWVSHVMEKQDTAYWEKYKRQKGAVSVLRLADALSHGIQNRRPDWPTPEDRAADLANHIRVSDALRKVRRRSRR
jgi:hypothetical protein